MSEGLEVKYQRGFTWRSILALLYCVVVFEPMLIWLYLMTGGQVAMAVSWPATLLFVELVRWGGGRLSAAEATVIFLGSGVAMNYFLPMGNLYALYYSQSGIAKIFGIVEHIPPFYAPKTPAAPYLRTFFHPDWFFPIAITLTYWTLAVLCDLSLGFIGREIFIRRERLPFPLQQPIATGIKALVERQTERLRVLAIFGITGLIYGLVAYGIPSIVNALKYYFQPIPVPWIDLNPLLHKFIRGASFGIATDAVVLASGIIIPLPVTVSIFAASLAVNMVINPILVSQGISRFAQEFFEGMTIYDLMQRAILHFWASPFIGIALGIGITPILRRPKMFIDSIKALFKRSERADEKGPSLLWLPLLLFVLSSLAITYLNHYLVPDFPVYLLLLLNVGWSFVCFLTIVRASGTAMSVSIPYVKELTLIASGYPKYDIWFAPIYTLPTDYTTTFKVCELTGTNPMDFVKTVILVAPISVLLGYIFLDNFWKIAPIPSATYRGVFIMWPIQASIQTVFITRFPGVFNPNLIVASFAVMAALYCVLDMFGLASAAVGSAIGAFTSIPIAVTMFIGSILAKSIERLVGKEWLDRNRAIIVAGISLGEALGILLGTAGAIIIMSMYGIITY